MTLKYFEKLQGLSVIDLTNKSKAIMKPFNGIVDQALSNLLSGVTNQDSFSQQKNDEFQVELPVVINDILEDESFTDDVALIVDTSLNMSSYTAPAIIPDIEISSKIKSLNRKQRGYFDIVQGWAKLSMKIKSMPDAQTLELLHICLTGNTGCDNSFLMKVFYQSLTKILPCGKFWLYKLWLL